MQIEWTFDTANPIIKPGQINGKLDAQRTSAAHVLCLGDSYRMYYWATDDTGQNRICMAQSSIDTPNDWKPMGCALGPQPDTEHNFQGPSFPQVVPLDDRQWLMYVCAWGIPAEGKPLRNTTCLAVSEDRGLTWRYWDDAPIIPLDHSWDKEGTGSCWVLNEGGILRMYYTGIGEYYPKPEGALTWHGDIIPRIGIGYAVSTDGIHWEKPLDDHIISPRGFGTDQFEYICSKPCIVREAEGYRIWVNTYGEAYRVRSLTSKDGLNWEWAASGLDGEFGIGIPGAFDDNQRSYPCVVKHGDEYRAWYTGNNFGITGMGYAVGKVFR